MSKKQTPLKILIILVISISLFTTIYYMNDYNNITLNNVVNLTKYEIDSQLELLKSDEYPDGTYNLETLEEISYNAGYQVSFYQVGDDYTEEEYMDVLGIFLSESSDGVISAGKYQGSVEISFNIESLDSAIKIAKEYNQISIWDWQEDIEIITGGTGIYE